MGGLRSRLDRLQRRLGWPEPQPVRVWWPCQEHPGRYFPCPIGLAPWEVLEREHGCVPEAELADTTVLLTWGDGENDRE